MDGLPPTEIGTGMEPGPVQVEMIEIPAARLDEYARIPIAFEVRAVFDVELVQAGLGGICLREHSVPPYVKDYDRLDAPLTWPARFDLTHWNIFLALDIAGQPLGGAVLAWKTPGLDMLEGRQDLSVLWDIRVMPGKRRQRVGQQLFRHAVARSKEHGCTQMKIETQNINVSACRFYAAQGAQLGDIRRFAYRGEPALAGEVQLNWYFDC